MRAAPERHTRLRVSVHGVVQGVGFRPFVHRLACEHGLSGWVRNDPHGVLVEVEGDPAAVERFLGRLAEQPPPLATVELVHAEPATATGERGFRIAGSAPRSAAAGRDQVAPAALVSPDVAPCEECLRELHDPRDRRYRYPFINCTNCGPRFTIVRATPYDRPLTTMAGFEMCDACAAEYADPASRRFHAQPNACPECGPALSLLDGAGVAVAQAHDALAAAVDGLARGRIVAVKGLGGYHLACRADDERVVLRLRALKRREEKPFALMASDLDAAARLVDLSPAQALLAAGPERPIVIARRRRGMPVAGAVAPGSRDLGVMLPSTPLHHLLLGDLGTALVMTSGNASEEPIAFEDDDAIARLAAIADALLIHDRPIHARADDSVLRALGASEHAADPPSASRPAITRERRATGGTHPPALMVRRSRGYVPRDLALPQATRPLLACGAELKSTFCLAHRTRAWVGPHVGDLRSWETYRSFTDGVGRFEQLLALDPEVVVHDLHPDYLSTKYALQREIPHVIEVQHHHAHFAAVLAEHGRLGRAVGAIYDGAGLGTDGSLWGGELLAGELGHSRRVGHLWPVRLPGGDAAAREPWRMACSWLAEAGHGDAPLPAGMAVAVSAARWEQVGELVRTGTASPITTSMGRLFDAVAALCAIRLSAREEGTAAMELEAAAREGERHAYPLALLDGDVLKLDARETVLAIVEDLRGDVPPALVSARFHNAIAEATVRALVVLAGREDTRAVVLAGGVFQNRLLLERCIAGLAGNGLSVLIPRELPPNDGAISYGQAAVAAARLD
ncbi:MAG TPA: carbamoyltransferase HypF [Solirubrobacteraceae bacterium]|nr:carbamoyltransferase HypF [Solirubrobacteraceae bacterium]